LPRINRTKEYEENVAQFGPNFLEGTARSLRVMALFGPDNPKLTLSEIAKMLDLPRATVRRTLLTLVQLDYMAKEGNIFWLTPRVLTFAAAYLSSDIIPTVMQPLVERASMKLQEACAAAILQQDEVVLVSRASPSRSVTADMSIGYRVPAYCSALGRVLLGALDAERLDKALSARPLAKLTANTLVDPEVVKARIIADREQGFSIADQEVEIGFRSIAVPVRSRSGAVVCALHVGAHTERASIGRMIDEFLPTLRAVAADASTMLA
jgi:IclR family pca regulon transcriptional regulator